MFLVSFRLLFYFVFFTAPAPTGFYTLSLHDALPISILEEIAGNGRHPGAVNKVVIRRRFRRCDRHGAESADVSQLYRSEEHTSELQSRPHLVCRLLLEKKKQREARAEHTRAKADSTR